MQEIKKVLKPGGFLAIIQYCYLPSRSVVAKETEDLILKINPTWNMAGFSGIYPDQILQVISSGFDFIEQFCYDYQQEFTHEGWNGRMKTCNGIGASNLGTPAIEDFEKLLLNLLETKYKNQNPLYIWHRLWVVVAKKL